ncbi:MAG TPA: hypothetical protein VKT28_12415 [Puia sp.]|nr:hypothetical protein [Puia sp.]
MAIQSNLKFSGTAGNLIFYQRFGGFYVRSRPSTVKQTTATKASAGKFGNAVRIAKAFRSGLQPLFNSALDKTTILRFNNAVYRYLLADDASVDNLPFISGFEFNEQSLLKERMKLTVSVNRNIAGDMQLMLPAFVPEQKMVAPAYTRDVTLRLAAAVCNMKTQTLTDCRDDELSIVYDDHLFPSQVISLPFELSDDEIMVIGCSLRYEAMRKGLLKDVSDVRWMPAGIVWAGRN